MIVADGADRRTVRERLQSQERRRRHASAADAAMPLAKFYRRRAGLPELPVGPAVCPPWCPFCPGRRSA